MTSTPGYTQAALDWIVAHGEPVGTFGTVGRIGAEESRATLARTGIDYDASVLGDLGGQSWSEDTYAEATDHPGLWALIVPVGGQRGHGETWFVDGGDTRLTLDDVLRGVLEAGQVGDRYWKALVQPAHAEQAQRRHEEYQAFLEAQARRSGVGGPVGRLS